MNSKDLPIADAVTEVLDLADQAAYRAAVSMGCTEAEIERLQEVQRQRINAWSEAVLAIVRPVAVTFSGDGDH